MYRRLQWYFQQQLFTQFIFYLFRNIPEYTAHKVFYRFEWLGFFSKCYLNLKLPVWYIHILIFILYFQMQLQRLFLEFLIFIFRILFFFVSRAYIRILDIMLITIAKAAFCCYTFSWSEDWEPFMFEEPIYLILSSTFFFNSRRSNLFFFFSFLYRFFSTTFISLAISLFFILYGLYFFQIQFLKQLAVWFVISMLFVWLISGFNFFLKRYRFGKFTSAIQRFWKRANVCFWAIEGFLFLLFFYYFLNSSQEPLYMYDYSSLNQEYLLNIWAAYLNLLILSLIIFFLYIFLLNVNCLTFPQIILFLTIISLFLFWIFFIETYQFYYTISLFNESNWIFNSTVHLWELEYESPRLRTKQYYYILCLLAKYWHFLFIFICWVFLLMKVFELKRIRYNLLALNMQNLIILYLLNLLCYVQWGKWLFRRYLDSSYYWFFTNYDYKSLQLICSQSLTSFLSLFVLFEDFFLYYYTITALVSWQLYLKDSYFLLTNLV